MFISLRSKPEPFCFSEERPQNFLCILSSNIFSSQPKEAKKTTSSLLPCLFYLNENESTKREAQDFEPPLSFQSLHSLVDSGECPHSIVLPYKTKFVLLHVSIGFGDQRSPFHFQSAMSYSVYDSLCFIASLFLWGAVFFCFWCVSQFAQLGFLTWSRAWDPFASISELKSSVSETRTILGLVLQASIFIFTGRIYPWNSKRSLFHIVN